MLSIKECRQLLGDESSGLSDREVTELRDQLYAVARLFIETPLPEAVLERAAIVEHDGGIQFEEAIRRALADPATTVN